MSKLIKPPFTKRIALFGRMGSGKSELSSRLTDFTKIAWGDAVKSEALAYGLTHDLSKIDKSKDRAVLQSIGQMRRGEIEDFFFPSGHAYMTVTPYGKFAWIDYHTARWDTETGKSIPQHRLLGPCYADYWVDQALPRIKAYLEVDKQIVNDDIRRWNEFNALKSLGFLMVKVHACSEVRIQRMLLRDDGVDLKTLNDISESELDALPFDVIINNNDTIEEAWNSLLDIISQQFGSN